MVSRVEVEERKYREAFGDFVESYRWQVYATLTFKKPAGFEWARRCSKWLVGRLGRKVYAFVALEKGVAGQRTHIHILLGWRSGKFTDHQLLLFRRWVQRNWDHGDQVKVDAYKPHGGAVQYSVKDSALLPEQGEFIGKPKKVRRRKRGKKKSREVSR